MEKYSLLTFSCRAQNVHGHFSWLDRYTSGICSGVITRTQHKFKYDSLITENVKTWLCKQSSSLPQRTQKKKIMVRYRIKLTKEEVDKLKSIIKKGTHTAHTYTVAHILLNCDEGEYSDKATNKDISKVLKVGMRTIDRVKKRFAEEGLESALKRKKSSRVYDTKLDGDVEAKLVQLCCSDPPQGYAKWSLRMLADKMVELDYVESISHVSVGTILKKTNLSLGRRGDG